MRKNNFSIIIPLLDRSEFTLRILSYLVFIKFECPVYLSDGSLNKEKNIKIFNTFKKKLKIHYLPFSYDKNYFFFLNKLFKTLKLIKTDHVLLLPNDDFININFIKKITKRNFSNKIISGVNLDFKIHNFFNYFNNFGKIKKIKFVKKNYNMNLCSSNKIQRVEYMKYFNPWESIFPKKILMRVLSYALEFKVKNHYEFMWFFKLVSLYSAKCIFFTKPLIARQANTYSSEGSDIQLIKNFSSKQRLEKFKKFIFLKTKNVQLVYLLDSLELTTRPNYSKFRILIQNIVIIKSFMSKIFSRILKLRNNNLKKNNYAYIFKFVNRYFEHVSKSK
jgi:hypothetical protein